MYLINYVYVYLSIYVYCRKYWHINASCICTYGRKLFTEDVHYGIRVFYVFFINKSDQRAVEPTVELDHREDKIYFIGITGRRSSGLSKQWPLDQRVVGPTGMFVEPTDRRTIWLSHQRLSDQRAVET